MMSWEKYKVDVPEGTSGRWTVKKFEVSEADATRTRLDALLRGRGYVPRGTYTSLLHGSSVIMSDTPDEIRDHSGFIHRAEGRVLIHGLGLGMCTAAVLRKEAVDAVTVVEASSDVVTLVAPWAREVAGSKPLEIIEGDAFTWKPPRGSRWDVVWHDIWPTLCEDNLEEMTRLHRRFGRRCKWQGSWGREILRHRRERRRGGPFSW